MNLPEWFSQVKIILVELASTVSLGLILVWLVWKEYEHLWHLKWRADMRIEDLCPGCKASHPSREHLNSLVPHGGSTRTEVPVGKGHWLEVSHYFNCPTCNAIWENIVESGAGGHGNFWNRVDPPGR